MMTSARCILWCVVIAGCARDDGDAPLQTAAPAATEIEARTAALLAPVRAVGVLETELAGRAAERAERDDVRRYAFVLAADHRAVVSALDSLARMDGSQYQPTATVRELEEGVRRAHTGLDSLSGFAFDLGFIRAQIEAQRQFVDRLDQELIPGMGGPGPRRELLQEVRIMADAHLTRGRQILATLLQQQPASTVSRPATPAARPAARPAAAPDTTRRAPPDTGIRPTRSDTTIRPRPDTILFGSAELSSRRA